MADQAFQGVSNNRTCQFCQRREASHFCKCTGSPVLFCLDCSIQHSAKNPRIIHQVIPIAALSQSPEEYMRKNDTLTKAAAELRRNVDRMEQCSRDFADMMQKCINYLIEYRSWGLQKLHTEKEELALAVETAIQKATHYLDQGVEPGGRAMWTVPIEELQVFEYTVSTPDLPVLCQSWARYQLKNLGLLTEERPRPRQQAYVSPVQPEVAKVPPLANTAKVFQSVLQAKSQLVRVTNSYIQCFDFQTGAWKQQLPLNPHIHADWNSSWVMLEDGSVFICGGGSRGALNTAYIVGAGCEEQGNMCMARFAHGVLAYSNNVYVFGGANGDRLKSCEKYHLQEQRWTLLPSMQQPRCLFNPCLFNGSIYLCGFYSALLEVFSPHNEQMLPFKLSMPAGERSFCCMYVEDNLLVVHLNLHILKYRAGPQLEEVSRSSTGESVIWQNSQPVVNAALRLYYIVQEGKCYCFNMDTGVAGPVID